ncbi:hypothetical protein [Xanthomarina spongicola]|uniref:Uncharacterized protein n=1 Tax=Xanthomarina spongicola TaxID=570520 RepID=A0A316DKX7_9FLAO|nr:hypothetical protein [Xanthomarina spongicola]PWK18238.1 hypothetical protein LX78_02148 [Xanthomarina spongicola]
MIQAKILFIEQEIVNNSKDNWEKLEAVNSIKSLIKQIDLNAEVVPLENVKKVRNLLESLKEDSLTKQEVLIVKELVKF